MIRNEGGFNVGGDGKHALIRFVAEILGGESCRFDSRVDEILLGDGTMFVRRPNCVCAETGLCLTVKTVLGSRNDESCHTQRVGGREKKR